MTWYPIYGKNCNDLLARETDRSIARHRELDLSSHGDFAAEFLIRYADEFALEVDPDGATARVWKLVRKHEDSTVYPLPSGVRSLIRALGEDMAAVYDYALRFGHRLEYVKAIATSRYLAEVYSSNWKPVVKAISEQILAGKYHRDCIRRPRVIQSADINIASKYGP